MLTALSSWATTLSLIFGGCCANALTLEHLTLTYPHFGSLITFLQFLIIALHGLPEHVRWTWLGPRLKPRKIPLLPYLGQVSLFYLISLLNNAAFGYRIPMPVHIIFRSGGLVVSMIFGWLIAKKRYNVTQVLSVFLVTVGVALTTLSAKQPSTSKASASSELRTYLSGIGILSAALVFSGFLGLLQEWTYRTYGGPSTPGTGKEQTWRESMFYLHFLGLPMFAPLFPEIKSQITAINETSPRLEVSVPVPLPPSTLSSLFPSLGLSSPTIPPPFSLPSLDFLIPPTFRRNSILFFNSATTPPEIDDVKITTSSMDWTPKETVNLNLSLPRAYIPLLMNTLTQLLCVSGVHRLTTRVSNLTVTLILVVRKAVSLVISLKGRVLADRASEFLGVRSVVEQSELGSWAWERAGDVVKLVLGVNEVAARERVPPKVDERMLWTGAALVLLGTLGYTLGTGFAKSKAPKAKKE
ncbi:hypothetical protein D9611_015043 [Ephemerocybe angulata]|uniref:UAA transporter n=1 Tax=Ephemerocybe angulata TaxID=980116 RepID=A0A8H5FIH5_9AGAR|nr:hypothetical protein D9611_015043 [Tulosesus angulatus]